MSIEDFPEKLVSKRDLIESNFIFSLYLQPDLVDDYKHIKNGEDIITEDGIFYYGIIQELYKAGYTSITDMAITNFCDDKPSLKKGYTNRGGWGTVQDLLNIVSVENIEAYLDDLIKSNILLRLYEKGFNILDELDKLNKMSAAEVSAYYEYLLADVCINQIDDIKSSELTEGYDEYIDQWNSKPEVGYPIKLGMLNYRLAGIHQKNLTLHLGGIGGGKTTTAVSWYILPQIKIGNNVCVIANEQDESAWRQMLLATVMFNELREDEYPGIKQKLKGLNRHKMLYGDFTDGQMEAMKIASEWLKQQKGQVKFIDIDNYQISTIQRIIRKYSKLGIGYFIVDTFKPPNDASERAWAEFSEVAKALFLLSKKTNTAILCTAQLTPDAMSKKYLDLTCVGKARAISETASTVIMFRPLTPYEKENIEPWTHVRDSGAGERELHKLDPNKDYIMIFTPKNRYGSVSPQIIVERNMDFNYYKEIGYYECPYNAS